MGSPSRNVQYHPPRLSEDRLNLAQPHSPSLPTHCSGKSGMRPVIAHLNVIEAAGPGFAGRVDRCSTRFAVAQLGQRRHRFPGDPAHVTAGTPRRGDPDRLYLTLMWSAVASGRQRRLTSRGGEHPISPSRPQRASEVDVGRGGIRGVEQPRHAAVPLDPRPHVRRDPAGHREYAVVVLAQGPREDRLVVRDPVPLRAQRVQRLLGLLARQGRAVVGKRAAERRPPERLLVVGLGAGPLDAFSGPSSVTQKTNGSVATTWEGVARVPRSSPAAGLSYHSSP